MQYKVTWTIDIEADNALDAAKQALEIQQDKGSESLYFEVLNPYTGKLIEGIDLLSE